MITMDPEVPPETLSETLSEELKNLNAGKRLELLYERLGSSLVASTSFGLQAAVMLKLLHDHAPKVPVIFIDTGFLFPETYRYAEELMEKFPLDYRIYHPTVSAARMQAIHGDLWEQGEKVLRNTDSSPRSNQ